MISLSTCLFGAREWPPGGKLRKKADKLTADIKGGGRAKAEGVYKEALAVMEGSPVADKVEMATCLSNLGNLYRITFRYAEALPYLVRAQEILEKWRGPEDAETLEVVRRRADCYRMLGSRKEHIQLVERLLAIEDRSADQESSGAFFMLEELVSSYNALGMHEKAEAAYGRLIASFEDPQWLGPVSGWDLSKDVIELPDAIHALHRRAEHLIALERFQEALPLYQQLVRITNAGESAKKLYLSYLFPCEKPNFNWVLVAELRGLALCLQHQSLIENANASRIEFALVLR